MSENVFQTSLRELFYQHTGGDRQMTEFCDSILNSLISDMELLSHCKKVAYYSILIFNKVKTRFRLTDENRKNLFMAALLHDVGKLNIPKEILYKPAPLTSDEFKEMKNHPEYSLAILSEYHFLRPVLAIIRYHHERFDGKGYPDGLFGDKIPLLSRIIAVADAFDAMTSQRPYKKGLPIDWAIQELLNNSGTQFDPAIAESMVELCQFNRISLGWEF
jgi:polar amino acid transport system substrate-binding protein